MLCQDIPDGADSAGSHLVRQALGDVAARDRPGADSSGAGPSVDLGRPAIRLLLFRPVDGAVLHRLAFKLFRGNDLAPLPQRHDQHLEAHIQNPRHHLPTHRQTEMSS